jgi:hypothetical protein
MAFFIFEEMNTDPLSVSLFEMRLEEIHRQDPWLRYEISIRDFIALFPMRYRNGRRRLKPEHPAATGVDREVFLKVLVAGGFQPIV